MNFIRIFSKIFSIFHIGAATFVIGVVAASIIIIHPFSLEASSIVRDLLFFIAANIWIAVIFKNEKVTYLEANGRNEEKGKSA